MIIDARWPPPAGWVAIMDEVNRMARRSGVRFRVRSHLDPSGRRVWWAEAIHRDELEPL